MNGKLILLVSSESKWLVNFRPLCALCRRILFPRERNDYLVLRARSAQPCEGKRREKKRRRITTQMNLWWVSLCARRHMQYSVCLLFAKLGPHENRGGNKKRKWKKNQWIPLMMSKHMHRHTEWMNAVSVNKWTAFKHHLKSSVNALKLNRS